MDHDKHPITGVIMAGGKSSRMGSDKGLLLFKGKMLVQYGIDLLKPFCSELLISTNNSDYLQFGLPLIADEIPDCGPMGGIYSALKASKTEYILAVACDMPFVTVATIQLLMEHIEGFDCVVPMVKDKLEPLCGVYSKAQIDKIEENIRIGELAMIYFIIKSNFKVIELKNGLMEFSNINSSTEYMKY
jgi:molybdenum cofactor guanylyltransferase